MEMHDMQEGVYSERTQDGTTIKIYLSGLHTQSKVPEWQKAAASLITAFSSWSITKLVAELLVKYVYAERGYFAIGSEYILMAAVFAGSFYIINRFFKIYRSNDERENKRKH